MSISSHSNQTKSYSLVGNSSRSSSIVHISSQGGTIASNFGVLSLASETDDDTKKDKVATAKIASLSASKKRISYKDKKPEKGSLEELDTLQNQLIKVLNVLLLNKVKELSKANSCSEDKVIIAKEYISKQYASDFVPSEDNQRSYINTIQKLHKNIKKAIQEIESQSNQVEDRDFEFTQTDETNLSTKEAIKSMRFKKEDFYDKEK